MDEDLDKAKVHLDKLGIKSAFVEVPHQDRTLHFNDPAGTPVELVATMENSYKAASAMYDEESAKNPKFKKIYDEWKVFRAEEAAWFALSESAMDAFLSSKL